MLKALRKGSTVIVTPPAVADTLNGSAGDVETISNGEKKTYLGIEIEAVPMYNLVLGPAPGKPLHHKGIGSSYILRLGTTRVYGSGDTECVPQDESAAEHLSGLCCGEPAEDQANRREAARCVREFRPKIVYPYHYRGQNTLEFADALKNTPGIEVRLRKLEGEP